MNDDLQVKHEQTLLLRLYNSYIYALRLPLPVFFLIMFATPFLLSIVFTAFYLLDVDGLFIPEDREWGRRSWWDNVYCFVGETHFKVFIFSLSLCTTFGGTGIEARSPYNLLLANLNTLMAQLVFVFLSGAGILIYLILASDFRCEVAQRLTIWLPLPFRCVQCSSGCRSQLSRFVGLKWRSSPTTSSRNMQRTC